MRISVILATKDRPDDVRRALKALTTQSLPAAEYEIVVVDNGPSDATKNAVSSYSRFGNLRYVAEPQAGLSAARNTGIKESKANLVAFTDDDAIADRYWLETLIAAFDDTGALCVGGRIEGHWLCLRPLWFPAGADTMLSILDLGSNVTTFSPPSSAPVGANIAFRRKVFDRHGLFNTKLGRGSSGLSGGEETELFMKIVKDGGRTIYSHKAIVTHAVGPEKLRPARLLKLSFEGGRLAAMLDMGSRPAASPQRAQADQERWDARALAKAMKAAMAAGYALQKIINPLSSRPAKK